jgi:hypothetical protein
MKNILAIIGGAFILFSVMSYTSTDGRIYDNYRTVVPLKQKGVVVTKNIEYVNRLMKKGWVVQDVDVTGQDYYNDIEKYYTLIKY